MAGLGELHHLQEPGRTYLGGQPVDPNGEEHDDAQRDEADDPAAKGMRMRRRCGGWGRLRRGLAGGLRVPGLDRRDEAVSAPREGLDVAGRSGIVIQSLADLLGGDVEAVIEIHQRVAPKPADQFLAGDDLAGTLQQRREKLEGTLLQFDFPAVLSQFALCEVNLEHTELEDLGGAVVRVHGSFHLDGANKRV